MEMDVFKKQDIFMKRMIADCGEGTLLEPIFKPYIDWLCCKTNKIQCGKVEAYSMLETASTRMEELCLKHPQAFEILPTYINGNPWQYYEGMKEDKYLYSYYSYIEDEMSSLLLGGYWG